MPGRKSDVLDCQWLQQLMSYGLLRGGFRPAQEICALRAVWRHRDMLLSYQARHVQHLQKAMTQMNVQLHHVISDIMGVTGQAIVRAIVAGERDAATLAKLRDRRIKADETEVAAALQGNWRDEHLFAFKQALALIDATRMDKPKAITVSAHKLARLVYFMLTKGQAFVEAGQDEYEERYRQRVVQNLTRRAHQLGFQLTPQETSSA